MAHCEFAANSVSGPYVKRCEENAQHYAYVPMSDDALVTEALLVCDKHADLAKKNGLKVHRNIIQEKG